MQSTFEEIDTSAYFFGLASAFLLLAFVLQKIQKKYSKPSLDNDVISGQWFGHWTMEPLREAAQFAREYSAYIDQKKAKNNGKAVFKIHPGIRSIALTDHKSCEFFFTASEGHLARENILRFGPLACSSDILRSASPALPSGPKTHDNALKLTMAILHRRSPDLERTWAEHVDNFSTDVPAPVIGTLVSLEVNFILRWLLGLSTRELPSMEDLEWARTSLANVLNTDSLMSWIVYEAVYRKKFSQEDESHLQRLLAVIHNSPYLQDYERMGAELGLVVDLDRWLLFTCVAAGLALGLTLHPATCRLACNPETVGALRSELDIAGTGLKPSRRLSDMLEAYKLPLLDSVAHECLRLATAPLFVFRKAQVDLTVPYGNNETVMVKKGTLLMASLAHMHTDPTVFGSNSHEFDARRFIDNPSLKSKLFLFGMSQEGKQRNPYGCAGHKAGFAIPLFKMALATLITEFSWQLERAPTFVLPRYHGSAGPVDLRFAHFRSNKHGGHSRSDSLIVVRDASPSKTLTFEDACTLVSSRKLSFSTATYLKLYGLYKQARSGDAPLSGPSRLSGAERTKWTAWNSVRGSSKSKAETSYIDIVSEALEPAQPTSSPSEEQDSSATTMLHVKVTESKSTNFYLGKTRYELEADIAVVDNVRDGTTNHQGHRLSLVFVDKEGASLIRVEVHGGSRDLPDDWAVGGSGGSGRGVVSFEAQDFLDQPVAVRCEIIGSGAKSWVKSIKLAAPELLKSYSFCVAAWTPVLSFESTAQSDIPLAREELQATRKSWEWDDSWLGDTTFPRVARDNGIVRDSFMCQMEVNPITETELLLAEISSRRDDSAHPASLDEYARTTFKQPNIVTNPKRNWRSNYEFAQSFISGTHPNFIDEVCVNSEGIVANAAAQRILEWLHQDPLRYDGLIGADDSLHKALTNGRLFIVDYTHTYENSEVKESSDDAGNVFYLMSPACLMLSSLQTGRLLPLAIEVCPGTYCSPRSSQGAWLLGRACVRSADTVLHSLSAHYLGTHLISEVIGVAMHRALPQTHPIK